jgi:hypothetical protein
VDTLKKYKRIDIAYPSHFDEKTRITHVYTDNGEYLTISPELTNGILLIVPPEDDPIVLEDESLKVYLLCDGYRSIDEIIEMIKEDYPEDDVESKVNSFIRSLIDEEILSW